VEKQRDKYSVALTPFPCFNSPPTENNTKFNISTLNGFKYGVVSGDQNRISLKQSLSFREKILKWSILAKLHLCSESHSKFPVSLQFSTRAVPRKLFLGQNLFYYKSFICDLGTI